MEEDKKPIIIEKKKKKKINGYKFGRRSLMTLTLGIMFGGIAAVTFTLLQPVFSGIISPEPESKPGVVTLKTDENEMSPEEMLSDYMQQQALLEESNYEAVEVPLTEEQIGSILARVSLDRNNYRQIYSALGDYIREMGRCIVTIDVIKSDEDWLSPVSDSRQTSGLIVAENGVELLILADGSQLREDAELKTSILGGESIPVTIKEKDPSTGLVILAAALNTLPDTVRKDPPIAVLGSSSYVVAGAPVIALGSPLGNAGSIGYGMINSPRSVVSLDDSQMYLVQTDIGGGNAASGAIFNLSGQVIGIIVDTKTAGGRDGLVCGYGISELRERIERMANGENIGYLGITGTDVTTDAHNQQGIPYGAYVKSVDINSPAMLSGIQTGDIIVRFGNREIINYTDYAEALLRSGQAEEIEIRLLRASQGEYKSITVTTTVGE
ncbi:MAG: S1C family serine protease [Lachnospiraceae bacterium]|nr:S1C family serine protease [Lachnospiraceae bacterium]